MTDEEFLRETEAFFHQQIPITRAMGVAVESFADGELVLTAPLAANHNHLGTAFGGSLSAVATLAGYGLLWLLLEDRECHIVVRNSAIHYERPVRGDIRAVCKSPGADKVATFKRKFARMGKARIRLHVTIEEAGEVCVEFEGVFVALK
jgi:thioesterase domain-containing protein